MDAARGAEDGIAKVPQSASSCPREAIAVSVRRHAVALLLVAALAACSGDDDTAASAPAPSPSIGASPELGPDGTPYVRPQEAATGLVTDFLAAAYEGDRAAVDPLLHPATAEASWDVVAGDRTRLDAMADYNVLCLDMSDEDEATVCDLVGAGDRSIGWQFVLGWFGGDPVVREVRTFDIGPE